MKKITLTIELEYDADLLHDNEKEEQIFFDMIQKDKLILHSNEIGDEVGTVKILERHNQ